MIGYVYKTTNLKNQKIYIGQHKTNLNELDPDYFGSGKLLKEAILKYGIENFKCEILRWCETEEELSEYEIKYIAEFKSTVYDNNYNISAGGPAPRLSGELNGNYGKHRPHTEAEKLHLSQVNKGHKPTFTGPHSDEMRAKMSIISRNNNLNRSKEIYAKVSESAKGNKMMHKDDKCIRVHPEEFDKYIKDGWTFGGLSRKGKYKNRKQFTPATFTTKDKVAVNNGIINKFVPKDELDNYLSNGFILGLKKRAN